MELHKIEKEEINKLHFLPADVLSDTAQKNERLQKLNLGMKLGNLEKNKCRIIFHSQEGDNYVETTIWALTDKYICLKGGVTLLIACILDVII